MIMIKTFNSKMIFAERKKIFENRWKNSPGRLTERRKKSSGLYVNGQNSFTELNKSRFSRTSLVSSHIFSVPVSLRTPLTVGQMSGLI